MLLHGYLHGYNQVWYRDELRLVRDFENIGVYEPVMSLRGFLCPGMSPGLELLITIMRHYQQFNVR